MIVSLDLRTQTVNQYSWSVDLLCPPLSVLLPLSFLCPLILVSNWLLPSSVIWLTGVLFAHLFAAC